MSRTYSFLLNGMKMAAAGYGAVMSKIGGVSSQTPALSITFLPWPYQMASQQIQWKNNVLAAVMY